MEAKTGDIPMSKNSVYGKEFPACTLLIYAKAYIRMSSTAERTSPSTGRLGIANGFGCETFSDAMLSHSRSKKFSPELNDRTGGAAVEHHCNPRKRGGCVAENYARSVALSPKSVVDHANFRILAPLFLKNTPMTVCSVSNSMTVAIDFDEDVVGNSLRKRGQFAHENNYENRFLRLRSQRVQLCTKGPWKAVGRRSPLSADWIIQ